MNIDNKYYTIFIRPQNQYIDTTGGMTYDHSEAMLMGRGQAIERVKYLRNVKKIDAVLDIYRPAWRKAIGYDSCR
jgi:hypothetical protein